MVKTGKRIFHKFFTYIFLFQTISLFWMLEIRGQGDNSVTYEKGHEYLPIQTASNSPSQSGDSEYSYNNL